MVKEKIRFTDPIFIHLGLLAFVSLGLGMIFQLIFDQGDFWLGLRAASVLIFLIGFVLYCAWRASKGGKVMAWMLLLAFILRLALGIFLAWGLPQFGYNQEPQETGFVFEDAYRREENAWDLAKTGDPLTTAFGDAYETDQYGGMLYLSAFIYRYLSPDAYRPALISILSAGAMALSIPFLVAGMRRKFSWKATLWAGWIMALYPEAILLGSSQLREPYFILIFSVMFWAVVHALEKAHLKVVLPILFISTVFLFLFSYRMGLSIVGVLAVWVWIELSNRMKRKWVKLAGWALILLAVIAVVVVMWDWLDAVLFWDMLVTIRKSGRVMFHLEALPAWMQFPFILVYGVFQPVLPAAIAAPAPWIWRGLGIFRAVGWYALLPLLAYALISVWRAEKSDKKRWLIVFTVLSWIWILIASARAGGDQWDNPRYRTIFLPLMSIAAGWAITFAQEKKDRWFYRALLIEGIFLGFFTNWYLRRYAGSPLYLEFFPMIAVILGLSALVIVGGWLWDRHRAPQEMHKDPD